MERDARAGDRDRAHRGRLETTFFKKKAEKESNEKRKVEVEMQDNWTVTEARSLYNGACAGAGLNSSFCQVIGCKDTE